MPLLGLGPLTWEKFSLVQSSPGHLFCQHFDHQLLQPTDQENTRNPVAMFIDFCSLSFTMDTIIVQRYQCTANTQHVKL